MAALGYWTLLAAAAASAAPASQPDIPGVTIKPTSFDLAAAGEHHLSAAEALRAEQDAVEHGSTACEAAAPGEIVVCARRSTGETNQRLPYPNMDAEPGTIHRYAGEFSTGADAGKSCARPGTCEPSRAGVTIGKIMTWLKGEDPDPDVP